MLCKSTKKDLKINTISRFAEIIAVAIFMIMMAFIGSAQAETILEECLGVYQATEVTDKITISGDPWNEPDGQYSVPGDTITIRYKDGVKVIITIDDDEKYTHTAIAINLIAAAIKNGEARAFRSPNYNYSLVLEECGSIFHLGPSDLDKGAMYMAPDPTTHKTLVFMRWFLFFQSYLVPF